MSNDMFLHDQSVGAIMMALQKSLMEQSDIVPVLKGLKFRLSDEGLMVMNPPLVKVADEEEEQCQGMSTGVASVMIVSPQSTG